MQCRRHRATRSRQANSRKPSHPHRNPGTRCFSDTTTTPRMGTQRRRTTPGGHGWESGRCWAQPHGARDPAEPPGARVPGGASHRGNDPRATCCTTRTLPNAALAMRSLACCNMPTWPLVEPAPGASANSPSAEPLLCWCPSPAADRHQDANAACAASFGAAVIVHQHDPNHPVLSNTIERLLERTWLPYAEPNLLQQMQREWNN